MTTEALMQTYGRLPVAFSHGEGNYLFDTDGKRYLDALAGIAVCGLGHAHPAVTEAISNQAAKLIHTSNLYRLPEQERLAERLCALTNMDRVFFGNSGAEANEAAIKLARLWGHSRDIKSPAIIAMDGSFSRPHLGDVNGYRKSQSSSRFRTPGGRFRACAVQQR